MATYKCPLCKHEMIQRFTESVSIGLNNSKGCNTPPSADRIFICENEGCTFGAMNENALKKLIEHKVTTSKQKEG